MQQPNRRSLIKGGLLSIAGMSGLPSLSAAVEQASTPYNRPKLRIAEVRTAEVRVHGYQVLVRIHFLVQEWHWIDNLDTWRNFVKEGEIIEKGFIRLPERAGIGVELNEDAARKVQVPGTPWFEPAGRGPAGRG